METRFLVPQYIETEPKIIGPITVRQFVMILVAGMLGFIIWKIFQTTNQNLGLGIIFIQTMIILLFAFAKVNGQTFHYFFLNIVRTMKKPKLKVWRKIKITSMPKEEEKKEAFVIPTKALPTSARLSDISLMVDTGGAYNIEENSGSSAGVEEMKIG